MARRNTSRSKELNFISSLIVNHPDFIRFCSQNALGGVYNFNDIYVEYGNISNIVSDLTIERVIVPDVNPKYIYHLDRLSKVRKKYIELTFNLPQKTITGSKVKADILIVDRNGKNYLVSFKDPDKITKLGQSSSEFVVGPYKLVGGHIIPLPNFTEEISFRNSAFTEEKFKNFTSK